MNIYIYLRVSESIFDDFLYIFPIKFIISTAIAWQGKFPNIYLCAYFVYIFERVVEVF